MYTRFIIFLLLLSSSFICNANPSPEEGKAIFMNRCGGCHNVNRVLTGPALAGLDQRRSQEWINAFIRSSQTMVKSGDKDAVDLYEKFNKIPMPDHADLTDENIASIIAFIKAEGKATAAKAPFARPNKTRPAYEPLSPNDYIFFICFLGLIALLITVLVFAVQTKQFAKRVHSN